MTSGFIALSTCTSIKFFQNFMEADFAKKYQKTNNRLCIEIKNFNVDVHHIFFIKFQSIKTSMVTEMVLNIAVVYFILY